MATIDLFGPVGDPFEGFTDTAVAQMAADAGDDLTVRLNSPGGFAFDGIAIYNVLKPLNPRIEIVGLAASAASVIAMAGREIVMRKGASLMIHNAWGITMGDDADHYKAGDTLKHLSKQIAEIYAERSGKSVEEMQSLMAAETWLDADGAVALGLATASDSKAANKQPKNAANVLAVMGCNIEAPKNEVELLRAEVRKRYTAWLVKDRLTRSYN
jgi:ATP-dependent protease ClpP protease subunit